MIFTFGRLARREQSQYFRIRASDRELAARRLCDATSVGVLSVSELEWRLDRVLSAATHGQLEALLLDVPTPRSAPASPVGRWLRAHIGAFAIINCGLAAIWAAAGPGYFWPVWSLIGWGMVLAGHVLAEHLLRPAAND